MANEIWTDVSAVPTSSGNIVTGGSYHNAEWHLEGTDLNLIQESPHPQTGEARGFTLSTMGCYRSSKLEATSVSDAMLEVEAICQTGWLRPSHLHSLTSLRGWDKEANQWIEVEDAMLPVKIGKKWHFVISSDEIGVGVGRPEVVNVSQVVLGRQREKNYSGCGRHCEDRLTDLKRITDALPDYSYEDRIGEMVAAVQTGGSKTTRHRNHPAAVCSVCADAAGLLALRKACECDDHKWQDKYGYPNNVCESCDGLTPWRAYTEASPHHQPRPERVKV